MSRSVVRVLALPILVIVAIWLWRSSEARAHHLRFVPPALEVTRVLYAAEETWGWGPGGNETGIIVYAMPEVAREGIEAGGIPWLNGQPGSGSDWQGAYDDWHATPFDPDVEGAFDIWAVDSADMEGGCGHGAGIAAYMFHNTDCIHFSHKVEALANQALSAPGSFYALGRIGMLLLIPSESRIIYAYNG